MSHPKAKQRPGQQRGRPVPFRALVGLAVAAGLFLSSGPGLAQGIVAQKVTGDISFDPDNALWKIARSVEITLAPQTITPPQVDDSVVTEAVIRALHNGNEIAIMLEWEDNTLDHSLEVSKFSDAAAVMFPSQAATGKRLGSAYTMGNAENMVNIWFWKAAWQLEAPVERTYAASDDFAGGLVVGNPVSKPKASPVESLVAKGFGTATDIGKEKIGISALGRWQRNRWSVVFKRALTSTDKIEATFDGEKTVNVAFAIWNGSEGHRGGRKVYSTWHKLGFEVK